MSMQGKVVVVTGSNIGIGLETAVGVAASGGHHGAGLPEPGQGRGRRP